MRGTETLNGTLPAPKPAETRKCVVPQRRPRCIPASPCVCVCQNAGFNRADAPPYGAAERARAHACPRGGHLGRLAAEQEEGT